MHPALPLLIRVLAAPESMAGLTLSEWELLVRQARAAGLLGRLSVLAEERAIAVPEGPDAHLRWAADYAQACAHEVRYEVDALRRVFDRVGVSWVLLKGAAYTVAGLAAGAGRFYEDVDILVPRAELPRVESALSQAGWELTHLDPYDQRYYRDWMHELPPMRHRQRGSGLDVHHNLLPLTGRLHPDAEAVIADAVSVPGVPGVKRPCAEDLLLHSAAHLFHDSEWDHALRDLSDMDRLVREFGDAGFWDRLPERARRHQLSVPLADALAWASRLLGTPVEGGALELVRERGAWRRRLLDPVFRRGFMPAHRTAAKPFTPAARVALLTRSHWLKMSPVRLAVHLSRKALRRDPGEG